MASVIDAFKETYGDSFAIAKIFVFAIPVYYSYQLYLQAGNDFGYFYFIAGVTIFFLLGFLSETLNNVITYQNDILPSLNPFKLAFWAGKATLAILPYALISILIANYLCSLINIIPWLDITLKVLIWFIVASIITTPFLLFSAKGNILDAYKIKLIADKSGDLIFVLLFFLIQLLILNIPTTLFIGYIIQFFLGFGQVFSIFATIAVVFNIAVVGHFFGQVYYENFEFNKSV